VSKLVLFNKPFNVLSQFSGDNPCFTLAHYIRIKDVYPAGRLDRDSEGLLLLTDDGNLQQTIANPRHKIRKLYWAQLEGLVTDAALSKLRQGVILKDGVTLPAIARRIESPAIWPRLPPIRERKNIPTCWIELGIQEGKNRQVRRMTAATGFPTLRLIRHQIGDWKLADLQPGDFTLLEI
jgi:23S rRNA pseudouridine2457 synthase